MRTTLLAAALLAAARAGATDGSRLDPAEEARARSLPHYATAGARLPDGRVLYGNLTIAAHDDGRVRVEFAAADPDGSATVQGELALAAPQTDESGALRSSFRAPVGTERRYANHGTLGADGLARDAAIVRSDLRMDADGLFVLDLLGEEDGRTVAVQVYGRALGTCWANEQGTLKRVADLSTRPDCQLLFGGL